MVKWKDDSSVMVWIGLPIKNTSKSLSIWPVSESDGFAPSIGWKNGRISHRRWAGSGSKSDKMESYMECKRGGRVKKSNEFQTRAQSIWERLNGKSLNRTLGFGRACCLQKGHNRVDGSRKSFGRTFKAWPSGGVILIALWFRQFSKRGRMAADSGWVID